MRWLLLILLCLPQLGTAKQKLSPKQEVSQLFQEAVKAFTDKKYQRVILLTEKIRTIKVKGETQYLNEAKQLLDRAKSMQREEFEPFMIQAKEKMGEGEYETSRDL